MSIDFRKMICKASANLRFIYDLFGCSKYYTYVDVCVDSGKLPDKCPEIVNRRFWKEDVPVDRCNLHPTPPTPPQPKYKLCSETKRLANQFCPSTIEVDSVDKLALVCRKHTHPRPSGVPLMILFVADFTTLSNNFSDAELNDFARRLGKAGVDYIRTFSVWDWAKGRRYVHPYKFIGELAEWDAPNPEYDYELARVQRILGMNGVGIYVDLFSQQADRYSWSPFKYNTDGLSGYHDISEKAMKRWKEFIDRFNRIMGVEGNMIGFGNEIRYQDEFATNEKLTIWANRWIVPLANHLRAKGVPAPNPFSASGMTNRPDDAIGYGTGGTLYTRLTKPDLANWAKSDTFWTLHGLAYAEQTTELIHLDFAGWNYGISDDGIGLGQNVVPESKQGTTESQDGRRSSHWTYRIKLVQAMRAKIGARLRAVEVMPMTLKRDKWSPDFLNQEEEVDVFWRIALEVYGKDIRRPIA